MSSSSSVLPSLEEVVAALGMQHPSPCTHQAPDTPILSASRCKFLVHWIWATYDGDIFADQVIVAGYEQRIAVPMFFRRVLELVDAGRFEFPFFLRCMRLIWSNARTFNHASSPVHQVALRLEDLWETRVVRAQTRADDEDPRRVTGVFLPFLFGLRETSRFQVFVKPVDDTIYSSYPLHVLRPACLESVIKLVERGCCLHHDDVVCECACARPFLSLSPLSCCIF